jgi:SAM-dependent methyltransferase
MHQDYQLAWLSPEGESYRRQVYERQHKAGTQPLRSNPTVDELRRDLRAHGPKTILEVGCGWGRLIGEFADEFAVTGCDVSPSMLQLCPKDLDVFLFDLAIDQRQFLQARERQWDVVFMRGVIMYLVDHSDQTACAMNNLLLMAKSAILVYEWPEVCAVMKRVSNNPKFEYHPIEHRQE